MAFRPKLWLVLWAGLADAQEGSPQPAPSEVVTLAGSDARTATRQSATNGMGFFGGSIADDSQVDVIVRPLQWTLNSEHLLGDWDGLHSSLEELGVTPPLAYAAVRVTKRNNRNSLQL